MQLFKLITAGQPEEAPRHANIINPSTGAVVGQIPVAIWRRSRLRHCGSQESRRPVCLRAAPFTRWLSGALPEEA